MIETLNHCLNPSHVGLTLQKTFEFIKTHQYNQEELTTTEVAMTINLIEPQFSSTTTPKKAVTNNVSGEIYKICETFVVIRAKNSYSPSPSYYYISYDKIIFLDSFVINRHYDEYVSYMNQLPKLCDDPHNDDYIMLNQIKLAISENLNSQKFLQYIYHGIRSDNHDVSNYLFVRNLLVVDRFYITPITVINGYALIPKN